MKTLMALLLSLSMMALAGVASAAPRAICKVATNDIGTITGTGSSFSAAFEDAASQCYDRRAQLYRMKKGMMPDEETALTLIDICANISCGG